MRTEVYLRRQAALQAKVTYWENKLGEFKKLCEHPNLTYKYGGSSGNWDRDEYYWIGWTCDCCNRKWTTDQSYDIKKDMLKKYPHAKEIKRW